MKMSFCRNVVTGVFCTTAIESAQSDKDIAIMKQMHKQRRAHLHNGARCAAQSPAC